MVVSMAAYDFADNVDQAGDVVKPVRVTYWQTTPCPTRTSMYHCTLVPFRVHKVTRKCVKGK